MNFDKKILEFQECENALVHDKDEITSTINGFFSLLDKYPQIGQTKVGMIFLSTFSLYCSVLFCST